MITVTAQMRIQGENPLPFALGVSELGGGALFGETIDEKVKFDRRNLLDLKAEMMSRSDIQLPVSGIMSNVGSISFKDTTLRFANFANAGLLKDGIKTEIFLNNTLSKQRSLVGTYYTADWQYDNENKTVSVSLKDDLEEWQDIQVEEMKLSGLLNSYDYYEYLKLKTPSKFIFKSQPLSAFYLCYFPYLEKGSLWSQWKKFCEVTQSCIYKNEKNEVIISSLFDNNPSDWS